MSNVGVNRARTAVNITSREVGALHQPYIGVSVDMTVRSISGEDGSSASPPFDVHSIEQSGACAVDRYVLAECSEI